jgi:hypothetical protein
VVSCGGTILIKLKSLIFTEHLTVSLRVLASYLSKFYSFDFINKAVHEVVMIGQNNADILNWDAVDAFSFHAL